MSVINQIRIKDRNDMAAAVPYLVGFHPEDSMVCVVLDKGRIRFVARFDLSAAEEPRMPEAMTSVAELLARYGSTVIIVGYGTPDRVDPVAELFNGALLNASIEIFDAIRVNDGRYYCLERDCDDGCPSEGVAYEPSASTFPAEATYEGVAPLPSRTALENVISPITGPDREAMRTASVAALNRLYAMLSDGAAARSGASTADEAPIGPPEQVLRSGVAAVQEALKVAARGDTLSDDDAAWLTAVLLIPEVRDHAWKAIDGSEVHRQLWIDVTRRALPETMAAPACLLAIAAYLGGDGSLANIAVDRSLRADPEYSLARLLRESLLAGTSPRMWRNATIGITD